MMKKNVLFVIDSLDCAGAEKSLVTLLQLLDYSKYSVDLQLFAHGHVLEELVPEEVNILKPFEYTTFTNMNVTNAIAHSMKKKNMNMIYRRLRYSIQLRKKQYNNRQKARLYWENASAVIGKNQKHYDVAIAYAQGVPTFYVAEKVKADKKLAWVNVTYRLDDIDKQFQKKYYDQFDKVIAVSHSTKDIFLETFPCYADVIDVVYDINNAQFISRMAENGKGYDDQFDGIRILTIGRLDHQKGYDIAIDACKRLKEMGVHFKWYVLGKGPLQKEIEDEIRKKNLSEHFILLGVKANPYPFIKHADIYVQTSMFEGFGIAIAEARMLNVPVVTTEFDAVYNQMVNEKNGLVVKMNEIAVCEGITRLINSQSLTASIIEYQKSEKKGNLEEIDKVYELLG
ncbi:glycosyltransferase [Evansella halocellulosilytica]|uniref:glycosyltransferase n=1 Tax=Evansella halocellulosilytica TaxID=2011013 RepID=UPI00211B9B94|nr:glycosyltransferase [Evansella halocellulosilytica]